MSKQVGARTHASAALAPHVSRTVAAGLAVLLTFGFGAAAQADEGSDASVVGGPVSVGAVDGTADGQVDGTADAGGGSRTDAPAEADATEADRSGDADGTIEISATSSDTDLVTLVVVTADGRRTTTVKPSPDAAGVATAPAAELRRAPVVAAALGRGKVDRTMPQTGKPEDAGHQEVVVCHNGRQITIDDNGLNGHGGDEEFCEETQGDTVGNGVDSSTGDASTDPADTTAGSEGGDASTGDEGSTLTEDGDDVDVTAPGHSEGGGSADGTPEDENGSEVVVALPDQDGATDRGPVVGKPGAGEPRAGKPGAGRPGVAKPADQVRGDEAERSGAQQPVGERAPGSRPEASPTGTIRTGTTGTAVVPGSAQLPAQRPGDEILGAAEGSARNRPAALVLPQTGAAESLALQTGAGLLMVLAGAMTLRGRRRREG